MGRENTMKERHKNIKPIYDLVVKKVFRNEEVALQFVKDIFELPAKSAKLIEGNQIFTANSNVESDFNIAVDILVELDNHAQVIIEVQLTKQVFFINRIWAYLCKQVNDNIERVKYIRTIARLVNNGILTKQMACEELGITEQEFEAYL